MSKSTKLNFIDGKNEQTKKKQHQPVHIKRS